MLTVAQKRTINNRVDSRLQYVLQGFQGGLDLVDKIKQLVVTSLNNKLAVFRKRHPVIWAICGIGRGIFNFFRRIIEPIINPLGFLRGLGNLFYQIFTDPVSLVTNMINNCINYATDDPVAFATDAIINILLIALPYTRTHGGTVHYHPSQVATTSAKATEVTQTCATAVKISEKAATIARQKISLPVRVPSATVQMSSSTTSTFANSHTFFSAKSATEAAPKTQVHTTNPLNSSTTQKRR